MPTNLSLEGVSSTESFYTKIHTSMISDVRDGALPPGKRFFSDWLKQAFPGDNRNLTVLDAGCGVHVLNGLTCVEQGFGRVFAIDMNPDAVEHVRQNHPEINVEIGSVMELPYGDGSFDVVVCAGVVHHTADVEKSLRELSRVLKPDGTAYISIYSFRKSLFEYVIRLWRLLGRVIPFDVMHALFSRFRAINNFVLDHMYVPVIWVFSANEVRDLITETGMTVVDEHPINYGIPKGSALERVLVGDGLIRVYVCQKPL
ncbi:MAG: class I SAM-dependent methyltransferase [Candidatus Hydrogenedentes bacterium]|nr:class I SAM-dependent methyltransferase [Candidatus Hydrogenedentota bacterium]